MRRRALFIAAMSAPVFRALSVGARTAKTAKIGVLVLGKPDPQLFLKTLREALRDLGYVEGRDIVLDVKSAEGDTLRLPDLAEILVRSEVDMIVAFATQEALAAKQATHELPIVMASVADPVGAGLVSNLSRPGENVTGSSSMLTEVVGKNLELTRELLPSARRLAAFSDVSPFTNLFFDQIRRASSTLGFAGEYFVIHSTEEFEAVFAQHVHQIDAAIIVPALLQPRVIKMLLDLRCPAVSPNITFAAAGGLMSYTVNPDELYRKAALYVDKLLKGAKPGDLPIEQATKFRLAINLKTAKALNINVPPSILARADEVIE